MGIGIFMAELENRLFCRLDGLTPVEREQKRLASLKERGLLADEAIAIFDEATQTAARFIDAPLCLLSLMTSDRQLIKSAVGLSRVGLMNELARSRQLPRDEGFCTYVVDSHQALMIPDTAANPVFASSLLVGHYGIRAYLGAPLVTADGQCLGTLAVMDWVPRDFNSKDAEFLAMTADWSLSEFERNRLWQQQHTSSIYWLPKLSDVEQPKDVREFKPTPEQHNDSNSLSVCRSSTNAIKVKLLAQLTQELRTPLTSIMGMASVLSRQVYGSLTSKQKEYMEIIHQSGQQLVSLVDEIVALDLLNGTSQELPLSPVDIEMLCQQAINSLSDMTQAKQIQLHLSVEPGSRIWLLNKDKVRHMLYYLVLSVIHSTEAGGEVCIHVSRKRNAETQPTVSVKIAVWSSHPWLGNALPQVSQEIAQSLSSSPSTRATVPDTLETSLSMAKVENGGLISDSCLLPTDHLTSSTSVWQAFTLKQELDKLLGNSDSRETLGLLLSCHLAELHGGDISVQGSLDAGYRYVISLPQMETARGTF
jgi:signal transduction histidine kinase